MGADGDVGIVFSNLLEQPRGAGALDPAQHEVLMKRLVGGVVEPAHYVGRARHHFEIAVAVHSAKSRRHQGQHVVIGNDDWRAGKPQRGFHRLGRTHVPGPDRGRQNQNPHFVSHHRTGGRSPTIAVRACGTMKMP